jgi:hypothetical protein
MNFTNKTAVGAAPHTDKLKLTEWFTRIDPQMIDYRFRVEDPDTFAAPFTMRMTITEQPGYQLYEYSCHEGNAAVGQALSGERAYEKQVAEAKAKGLPIPPRTTGDGGIFGRAGRGTSARQGDWVQVTQRWRLAVGSWQLVRVRYPVRIRCHLRKLWREDLLVLSSAARAAAPRQPCGSRIVIRNCRTSP